MNESKKMSKQEKKSFIEMSVDTIKNHMNDDDFEEAVLETCFGIGDLVNNKTKIKINKLINK